MDKNRLPMDDPDEAALQELDAALARWLTGVCNG